MSTSDPVEKAVLPNSLALHVQRLRHEKCFNAFAPMLWFVIKFVGQEYRLASDAQR